MSIVKLISELEASTGPNRWLDAKIDALFRIGTEKMRGGGYEWAWKNFPTWAHHTHARGMCGVQHQNGDLGLIWDSEPFTGSVDAALALMDKAMGRTAGNFRFATNVRLKANGETHVQIFSHERQRGLDPAANHRHPAIALCIATLKAKQAQEVVA